MKVYVVIYYDFYNDSSWVDVVCATREKAEKYIAESGMDPEDFDILEYEVI